MIWVNVKNFKPEPFVEVLALVDGKRSASWSNSIPLVAYVNEAGEWFEQSHPNSGPIPCIIAWTPISIPSYTSDFYEKDNPGIGASEVVIVTKEELRQLKQSPPWAHNGM